MGLDRIVRASVGLSSLRPVRRIFSEVLAVLLWPLECVSLLLLPVLPFAAVGFAEFERGRARECGQLTPSQRPPGQVWTTWAIRRVGTPALWRHDIPLTLASAAAGLAAGAAFAIALLAFVILAAAPVVVAQGGGITVGSVNVTGPFGTLAVMLFCLAVLTSVGAFLTAVSVLRDALVRAFSRDGAEELTARLDAVQSNRAEIVMAFEQERRRIEHDLHDGVQQDLLALSMTLGMLEYRLESAADAKHALALRARSQVEHSLKSLREIVHGIHPRELSDLGLRAAMTGLCERSALDVELKVDRGVDDLDISAASALYFTAAEALNNVERHAGTKHARVVLTRKVASVRLMITDAGTGNARFDNSGSTGLVGLRERMRGVGGDLRITSSSGNGTRIEAMVFASRSTADGASELGVNKETE